MNSAPLTRTVCQLTGDVVGERPTKYFEALAALDDPTPGTERALPPTAAEYARVKEQLKNARIELDDTMQTLRETGATVATLTAQAAMWHADRDEQRERADDAEDLAERLGAHLTELEAEIGPLRARIATLEAERDTAVAKASL